MIATQASNQGILPFVYTGIGITTVVVGVVIAVSATATAVIVAGSILSVLGLLFVICIESHKRSICNLPDHYTASLLKFAAFWIAEHFTSPGPLTRWESELAKKV